MGTLISKIYDVDNLGRIAIQSNLEKDFESYGEENKLLITEIDSFGLQMDNEKQVFLLDSLKIILHQKVSNIEELKKIPEITECYYVTGSFTLYIKIIAKNHEHMRRILYEKIDGIPGIAKTDSIIELGCAFKRNISL